MAYRSAVSVCQIRIQSMLMPFVRSGRRLVDLCQRLQSVILLSNKQIRTLVLQYGPTVKRVRLPFGRARKMTPLDYYFVILMIE